MKWVGLALNFAGWFMVVWGISRKSTARAWMVSVAASMRAVRARTAHWFRELGQRLRQRWLNTRSSFGNAWQGVRELFGKSRQVRIQLPSASVLVVAGSLTVTRGPPTPEGNEYRTQRIEERMNAADDEALFADGLVVIGGLLTITGAIVLFFT